MRQAVDADSVGGDESGRRQGRQVTPAAGVVTRQQRATRHA